MKTSPMLTIVAILISGIVGFLLGRAIPADQKIGATVKEIPKVKTDEVKPPDAETASVPAAPATGETSEEIAGEATIPATQSGSSTSSADQSVATIDRKKPGEAKSGTELGAATLKRFNMGISDNKISKELAAIAESLEKKNLAYVSSLSQDCSGIFHQMKDSLQKRIPVLRHDVEYQYPLYSRHRSSRQIADWYWENDNLLIVEDAVASRNSIRPGAVMFFGKPHKKYKNMTIEQLTDKENNYTSNGYIMHIAVVTSVRTDEDGNVVDYTMMHGRNPSTPASRSGSKQMQSTRTKGLPPFGNWSQQWVAVANIATPKQ